MGLTEVQRVVSVGKSCDRNVYINFIQSGVPYLTSCNNVFVSFFAGNQKIPFVKFSYKPLAGYKSFTFENVGDEAAGKALLIIDSEDTAKAIEGVVRIEMNIELIDNTRTDLGFDCNVKNDLFKFI